MKLNINCTVEIENEGDVLGHDVTDGIALQEVMGVVARHYIREALKHTGGNKTDAAALLGLGSYQTLTNWIDKYNIKEGTS